MPVITETVETDLPVEAAFDYVANFENIVEWDPGVTAVRKMSDGPAAVGTEYELDLNYGGSPLSMVYRITVEIYKRVSLMKPVRWLDTLDLKTWYLSMTATILLLRVIQTLHGLKMLLNVLKRKTGTYLRSMATVMKISKKRLMK